MSDADWDALIGRAEERGAVAFDARELATDRELERIGHLKHLQRLDLWRCDISDDGLQHLAGLSELREIALGLSPGVTDAGLAVLRRMRKLTSVSITHLKNVTDAGIAHLAEHGGLQAVTLFGTNSGDGALRALSRKPDLDYLWVGNRTTDAGLVLLHEFPGFTEWRSQTPRIDILDDSTGVAALKIDVRGPITDRGLDNLAGLDGLAYVRLMSSMPDGVVSSRITPRGIGGLSQLPHLTCMAWPGSQSDDNVMAGIARLPHLRYLSTQTSIASDAGFERLAESKSLEHLFAPGCANITGKALDALSRSGTVQALAVGGPQFRVADFDALPQFPHLRQLLPVDAEPDAFRAIGEIESLEILDCMFARRITDDAIRHLRGLSNLRRFRIWGREITDESLVLLSSMQSLQDLEFEGCRYITDSGVDRLAALPHLRRLTVTGCPGVSAADRL